MAVAGAARKECRAKSSPYLTDDMRKARIAALYAVDEKDALRYSHENPEIQALYGDFYDQPLSGKAEKMLHTSYASRKVAGLSH